MTGDNMRNLPTNGPECTGCSACAAACPKKAVKMTPDGDGFLYPVIESSLCVDCGLCAKICPVNAAAGDRNKNVKRLPDCYAAVAKGDHSASTSGGIFPALANTVLAEGGFVCAATLTPEMTVKHRIVFDAGELDALKGSKYVQSEIGDCFYAIKDLLDAGRKGMFVGTPCQAAGLKAFLRGKTDNLLLVDLFCHAVSSAKVFRSYLSSLPLKREEERIMSVNFRDKRNNIEHMTGAMTVVTDKNVYSCSGGEDSFMQSFLHNLSLRKSCGNCLFSSLSRQGDISLGDFWGIGAYDEKLNDRQGISAVLVNTNMGRGYWAKVSENLSLCRKVPVKYAVAGNQCLRKSFSLHKNREAFFAELDTTPFAENVKRNLNDKADCAVLNMWHTNNYGAILTCYALAESLKAAGYKTKVVKYVPPNRYSPFPGGLSEAFSSHFDLTDTVENAEDFRKLNDVADTFIVGSDQVWRWWQGRFGYDYFLAGISSNKKKISYAASFGKDRFEGSSEVKDKVRFYLNDFDAVSVREDDGVEICRRDFGIDAVRVLDPVFIADRKIYDDLADAAAEKHEKPFIAAYIINKTQKAADIISAAKRFYSIESVSETNDAAVDKKSAKVSVEQWLYDIKNCELLVTDSFHGLCFAVMFVYIPHLFRGYSRIATLLNLLGLNGRSALSDDAETFEEVLRSPIDYGKVNSVLKVEKERSLSWLLARCAGPRRKIDPAFDMMRDLTLKVDALAAKVNKVNELTKAKAESPSLAWRLFRYWLSSKIFWGKKAARYREKYRELADGKKRLLS